MRLNVAENKKHSDLVRLVGSLLLISLPLRVLFALVNFTSFLPEIVAAGIIGSKYALRHKKSMPDKLQEDVTFVYGIVNLIMITLLLLLAGGFDFNTFTIELVLVVFYAIVLYWGLETWAVQRGASWLEIFSPRLELLETPLIDFPKKYPLFMLAVGIEIFYFLLNLAFQVHVLESDVVLISCSLLGSVGLLYPSRKYMERKRIDEFLCS